MSAVLEVQQQDFQQKIERAEGLVVVDFSATWCGPCQRMLPELESAAQEFEGQATFLKVDIDESPDVAMRYGVQGIPNITFLKGGQVVDVSIGIMPKSAIVSRVRKNL
jgi:thioredoxin 1